MDKLERFMLGCPFIEVQKKSVVIRPLGKVTTASLDGG